MRKAALSITVLAVVALVAVFQMQPVRADSGAVSPGKPSNVSAEYQGESSISVSWNASPRESAGILYEVFYRPSGASEWTSATAAYTGSRGGAYSINDPIVVPSLGEYQVRVKACNYYVGSNVLCDNSDVATVQVGAVPAKPTGLTLTQVSAGHDIDVTWDAVADADNYRIRWRAKDDTLGDPIYATTTKATISLDEYGDWVVRVEACNDVGCGKPASNTITTAEPALEPTPTPTPRPVPPTTGLAVTTQMNSLSINISWHDHGDHQYYVRLRKPHVGFIGMRAALRGKSNTTIKVREYGDWVVGVESCFPRTRICGPIAEKRISVEGTTPARMSNFEARDAERSDTAMAVSWDRTEYATHYEVKWRKRGEKFKSGDILKPPGNQTSAVIELPDSHDWVVRARACNVNLCGPAGTESVSVTVVVDVPTLSPRYRI